MTEKRGFVVCGPESSGNHMMSDILEANGCTATNDMAELERLAGEGVSGLVWRGSMPKGGDWYDLKEPIGVLESAGYRAQAVITTREWVAMAGSQVKIHPPKDFEHAVRNIQRALVHIFADLGEANIEFVLVSYESLAYQQDATLSSVARILDFPLDAEFEVYNGNLKWYE